MADAQITSVLLADKIIKDQKEAKKAEVTELDRYLHLSDNLEKSMD